VPPSVLGKNFGASAENFGHTPDPEQRYIFPLPIPGPPGSDRVAGGGAVPDSFSFRLTAQTPLQTKSGIVRIADSNNFKAAKTIAAALVEVEPGGMRELHWHPNADEWQYYIAGQARMGVFGASEDARTFDFQAGDVGYVPFAMGHYIENTGNRTLRFLEMFRSPVFADVSLNQWMALTPPELVQGHLKLNAAVMQALQKTRSPIVPG
jgi:oxalate decarboxylase